MPLPARRPAEARARRSNRSCPLLKGDRYDSTIKLLGKVDVPMIRKNQGSSLSLHHFARYVQAKSHAVRLPADERLDKKIRRVDEPWSVVGHDDGFVSVEIFKLFHKNLFLARRLTPFVVEPPDGIVDQVHDRRN